MDPTIIPSRRKARGHLRVPSNQLGLSNLSEFSPIPSGMSGINERSGPRTVRSAQPLQTLITGARPKQDPMAEVRIA